MNVVSKNFDLFLIKFPIIFPIIYCFFLYTYPTTENFIIYLTILILAEPHFGATWPFFINSKNKKYILENKISLIIIPFSIVGFCILGFFLFLSFFLLVFFAANIFHVTRQSLGICKLYEQNKENIIYTEYLLYIFNLLFFLVGIFRFYIPIIDDNYFFELNISFLALFIVTFILTLIKYKNLESVLILFTGIFIFYPICFVENPVHAILMGVTMHYTQYLALTYKVTSKRIVNNQLSENNFDLKNIINYKFIFFLLIYSIFMTIFSFYGKNPAPYLKNLLLIPVTAQMLHFYIDSQLWKFSIKFNRENVLKYIFEKW